MAAKSQSLKAFTEYRTTLINAITSRSSDKGAKRLILFYYSRHSFLYDLDNLMTMITKTKHT